MELFAAPEENRHWTGLHTALGVERPLGNFTPLVCKIWNLSLRFSTWPSLWKRAHVTPLPEVDVPKGKTDYRRINIAPLIARAFEKSMYNIHAGDTVEQRLSSTQFSYRTGGSCIDALLSMRHTVYWYLDDPKCKAMRLFARDFSKAFDSVNHELLSYKLQDVPLNPFIINWYLSFLENRQQCIIYNSFQGQWKCVKQRHSTG